MRLKGKFVVKIRLVFWVLQKLVKTSLEIYIRRVAGDV